MKKFPVHQLSFADIMQLRGDTQPDRNLYLFSKKDNHPEPKPEHPHRTDFYTLLLITKGSLPVTLNLVDYTAEKNSLLLLHPQVTFRFADANNDLFFYGIAFTADYLSRAGITKKYLDTLSFLSHQHQPVVPITQRDTDVLCRMMNLLYQRNLADEAYPFRTEIIHHLFSGFLYELAAVYKNNQTTGQDIKINRNEEIAVRFLTLLPQHCKEEQTVKWYANHLHVPAKYLSQVVKEATGKTASHFINEMVLLEAKLLLDDAALSIAQVADALHFSDPFVFSKFFKRITGITPTDYRRRA